MLNRNALGLTFFILAFSATLVQLSEVLTFTGADVVLLVAYH